MNLRGLDKIRDSIVHVVPDLRVGGVYEFVLTAAKELARQYQHVLLTTTPLRNINLVLVEQAQAHNLVVEAVDTLTSDYFEQTKPSGAIFYNVQGAVGIGNVVPSIYYSYGVRDDALECAITVPCSSWACYQDNQGHQYAKPLREELMLAPFINSRQLRRVKARKQGSFTVGLICTDNHDKYPGDFVIDLVDRLPDDVNLMLSIPPKFKQPGVPLALDTYQARTKRLIRCPLHPLAGVQYALGADVIMYCTATNYHEPYGRFVMEAMGLGKPVICERKGIFGSTLQHGINALLFDTPDEAIEHLKFVRNNIQAVERLGANAQLYASHQDTAVHIGKLKRLLRSIGV